MDEKFADYKIQIYYEKLINIKKRENLNGDEDIAISREIKRIGDILLYKYKTLNTVWNNPIFMDKNILFPIYSEIESYRLLNRFNLTNSINNDNDIEYSTIIPGSIHSYERVINELLTNKKLALDENHQNKIIANLLSLGWNPEIEIGSETKNICREKFGYKLTNEINESCYFIDCSHILRSFQGDDIESNIHPYYILIATDNNYSIYGVFKDNLNNIKQFLGDYDGNINLYLFFAEDMDVESDNWRSEEYDIIDKSHPSYRYYIDNLMVARIIKSIESKNPNKINLPTIVKLVAKNIDFRVVEYLHNLKRFANYCILTDNSEIILNYQSHIISPLAYTTACMNVILEV